MPSTVIIAESSPEVASMIAEVFEESGYEVSGIYADGLSAMRAAKKTPPSVVTLDLILPRLSGLQLANALAKLDCPPLLIALSAVSTEQRLEQAKDAGVEYYLLKPVAPEALRDVIHRSGLRQSDAAVG